MAMASVHPSFQRRFQSRTIIGKGPCSEMMCLASSVKRKKFRIGLSLDMLKSRRFAKPRLCYVLAPKMGREKGDF